MTVVDLLDRKQIDKRLTGESGGHRILAGHDDQVAAALADKLVERLLACGRQLLRADVAENHDVVTRESFDIGRKLGPIGEVAGAVNGRRKQQLVEFDVLIATEQLVQVAVLPPRHAIGQQNSQMVANDFVRDRVIVVGEVCLAFDRFDADDRPAWRPRW